jgi:hypothetical protein
MEMIRLLIRVMLIGVLVIGLACRTLQSEEIEVAKEKARRIGYQLAKNDLEAAKRGVVYMTAVVEGDAHMPVNAVSWFLAQQSGDPLFAGDLNDLITSLRYVGPEPSDLQVKQAKAIAAAFIEGTKMGGL